MKEIIISLGIGILAATAAYVLQGVVGSKSRSSEKLKTGFDKKNPETAKEEAVIDVQQPAEQTERLIPTRSWTGGQR